MCRFLGNSSSIHFPLPIYSFCYCLMHVCECRCCHCYIRFLFQRIFCSFLVRLLNITMWSQNWYKQCFFYYKLKTMTLEWHFFAFALFSSQSRSLSIYRYFPSFVAIAIVVSFHLLEWCAFFMSLFVCSLLQILKYDYKSMFAIRYKQCFFCHLSVCNSLCEYICMNSHKIFSVRIG